jgi:D-amino-acid dehydrogenase
VNLPGRRLAGACAVLAAGAWSDGLARSLGLRIPFAAEGGSHVHVGLRGNHGLSRPVNDTGGGWVASPAGGTVRLLTGVRLARADDAPDDRQLRLVLADAARTLPLGDPVPGTEWHGGRPSTPDGLPVIGPAPGAPRVILAFGHGHVGFSTAPVTAGIVADLATGRAPAIPMASFAAERFARAPR